MTDFESGTGVGTAQTSESDSSIGQGQHDGLRSVRSINFSFHCFHWFGGEFQQAMAEAMPEIAAILADEEPEPVPEEVPDDPAAQLQAAVAAAEQEIAAIVGAEDEPEEEPAPRRPRRTRRQAADAPARRRPRQRRARAEEPAPEPVAPPQIGDAPTEGEEVAAQEGMAELASLFTPEMLAQIGAALKD